MTRREHWGRLFLLALFAASVAFGQIRSGTITGTVTDASGGSVAGAQVTVTEQQTAISNNTKTTEAGAFTVPYLPAGSYSVAVTASGFADYRQKDIVLATAQTFRVDVALKLATLGAAVEVSGRGSGGADGQQHGH